MQKKYWIGLTVVIAALATLLVSGKPGTAPASKSPWDICCEWKAGDCDRKVTPPGQTPLESMSRQFIFISSPGR